MPTATAHPERAELQAFAAKRLDADATAKIERHLGRCAACRALVASTPPPTPDPAAAMAAADMSDLVATQSIHPTEATLVQPRVQVHVPTVRSPRSRRLRITAALLAVLVVALLTFAAWYVTTDSFHSANSTTSSASATSDTSSFDDSTQPV